MSDMFAISRIENYKYSDCGGVLKEALRTLPNYDNPDCDPSLSHLNYAFISYDSSLSVEKYIVNYREKNNIKGRFNLNTQNKKNATNVMSQALFTATPDYLKDMSRDDIISFYSHCYEFFKSEFDVPILSAVIHFDETTPHLHITFLPIVSRINKKTKNDEKIFSTTLLMPGKDYFPKYQDRFYQFISEKYDGLSRKNSDNISRHHLSVKEYKEFKELQNKCDHLYKELNACKKTIFNQKQKISSLYNELSVIGQEKLLLERLPLIGLLFQLLRKLSDEQCRNILEQSIEDAKCELSRNIVDKNKVSLDAQIMSASKKKIIDRLFNNKNNFER